MRNLKATRKAKGLTREQLAKAAGIHPGTLDRYESGQRYPTVDVAIKLSDALGVTVRELMGMAD